MNITLLSDSPGETLLFAREELEKFFGLTLISSDLAVTLQKDDSFAEEEYSICGKGDYLLSGGSDTALLYASYRLLEELGFAFLSPDPWDTVVPEKITALPDLAIRTAPRFPWRGFFGVEKRDTPEFLLWMARNGMNFWSLATNHPDLCRKLGMKLRGNPASGTHRLFEDYLNPEQYFAVHPEYYAWDGEKRNPSMVPVDAWNICTSNPEAADQLAENLIRDLNPGGKMEHASFLSFAPFDNGQWCQCEACQSQGNRTTRFLLFADRCSRAIRKAVKRPVWLLVSAYHETLMTPDQPLPDDFDYERIFIEFFPIERCYAHDIDDSSCKTNSQLNFFLQAWAKLKKFRFFVCEYYNVSTFSSAAIPLDRGMEHDLAVYAQAGAAGITYMHVSTALWGELALNNCGFAGAAWGKPFSREAFLKVRYGASAEAMKDFYEKMECFTPLSKPVFHYQGTGELNAAGNNTVTFSIRRSIENEERPLALENHCDLEKMENALCAMTEAGMILAGVMRSASGVLKERLKCDQMRFDYTLTRLQLTVSLVRIRTAERNGETETAQIEAGKLLVYGEKLREIKEAVQHIRAQGAPNEKMYFNGLTSSCLQNEYAKTLLRYGLTPAPFEPDERVTVIQG